jgi:WD40 repeat protein
MQALRLRCIDTQSRLWDAATGAAKGDALKGHTGWVFAVLSSPDGSLLASALADKTVRLWDAATGAARGGALEGHTEEVTAVTFSPEMGTSESSKPPHMI